MTIRLSTQPHYNVRQNLSTLLELPEENVRVIAEDVGGGFGSKSRPYAEEIIVYTRLDSRLIATPEMGYELAGEGLNFRLRRTEDGWEILGFAPFAP